MRRISSEYTHAPLFTVQIFREAGILVKPAGAVLAAARLPSISGIVSGRRY